jgi:hypothetical protein
MEKRICCYSKNSGTIFSFEVSSVSSLVLSKKFGSSLGKALLNPKNSQQTSFMKILLNKSDVILPYFIFLRRYTIGLSFEFFPDILLARGLFLQKWIILQRVFIILKQFWIISYGTLNGFSAQEKLVFII